VSKLLVGVVAEESIGRHSDYPGLHIGDGRGGVDLYVIPVSDCPGVSVDSEFVHFQWRARHEDLKTVPFPMLSDIKRELVNATGVLNAEGVADRATFLVDPNNEIQFVPVTAGSVGRNVDVVLRVLDALQSDELCACNWRKGDPTLDAAELLEAS
jgi:peroxiredoxin (alkyl hydroperoxide reductase subunit C)